MTLLRSRFTIFWLLLVAATLLSFESSFQGAKIAGVAIIGIGLFKAWIVGREFMELRDAPLWLRSLFEAWVLVLGAVLICVFCY
jgi:hypothetical protein